MPIPHHISAQRRAADEPRQGEGEGEGQNDGDEYLEYWRKIGDKRNVPQPVAHDEDVHEVDAEGQRGDPCEDGLVLLQSFASPGYGL